MAHAERRQDQQAAADERLDPAEDVNAGEAAPSPEQLHEPPSAMLDDGDGTRADTTHLPDAASDHAP